MAQISPVIDSKVHNAEGTGSYILYFDLNKYYLNEFKTRKLWSRDAKTTGYFSHPGRYPQHSTAYFLEDVGPTIHKIKYTSSLRGG